MTRGSQPASDREVERVGFLGLGPMGLPMAHALADAGFEVVAWNRTGAKVDQLRTVAPTALPASTPVRSRARLRP